jgi:hypothetical protein
VPLASTQTATSNGPPCKAGAGRPSGAIPSEARAAVWERAARRRHASEASAADKRPATVCLSRLDNSSADSSLERQEETDAKKHTPTHTRACTHNTNGYSAEPEQRGQLALTWLLRPGFRYSRPPPPPEPVRRLSRRLLRARRRPVTESAESSETRDQVRRVTK